MLSIVGGGQLGSALAAAYIESNPATSLTIVERNPAHREQLAQRFPGVHVSAEPVESEGVIIAVKPNDVELAINDAVRAKTPRIVSVAAGVTLKRLHEYAGGHVAVFRAMPNIGALVKKSATALCIGQGVHPEDLAWSERILATAGIVVRVTEAEIDAVTGLSGSGLAYVFTFVDALIDAGVHSGLSRDVSRQLVMATLSGAAGVLELQPDPVALRDMVVTPAGTTAAGLRELERHGLKIGVIDAVLAATERSRELGRVL